MDELRKRKAGLENAALMMAAEGVAVPPELSDELSQLVKSLAELSETSTVQKTWTSFLGEEIEGFVLREKISSGTYSHLFRAVHERTGEICAIKIARTHEPIVANPDDYFSKQAIRFHLELCQYVDVSPNEVLKHESERLQADKTGHFVKMLSSGLHQDLFYYRMPFLEAVSLKSIEDQWTSFHPDRESSMPLEMIRKTCSVLDDFFMSTPRQYHGNLRPDSIVFTKSEFVLLSPGIFEMQDPSDTQQLSFMITTPAYYPFFEPNDLFALGATLWESLCKVHPLDVANLPEREGFIADEFREMLEYRRSLNHTPLWQILKMRLPRDINNSLTTHTEALLLKALKLDVNSDGLLTGSPGYESPAELIEALNQLEKTGWRRKK